MSPTRPFSRTKNNSQKTLAPVRKPHSIKPALVALPHNNHQAAFVAQRILELADEGVPLEQIAVLYRAHYHSMEVQLEFTRRGIPFSITSGLRFFEQAHIKDVAAFLKFTVNPRDETAFKRMIRLQPGIGNKTAEALWQKSSAILDGKTNFADLASLKVPSKAQKSWEQFVHTLSRPCSRRWRHEAPRHDLVRPLRRLRGLHEREVPELRRTPRRPRHASGIRSTV
jgi:DNA helicase-2/ATP-dependent DNA helicase PcrA